MPLDDTTRAPRRAPKITQADRKRWRQVRAEWLERSSYRPVCTALWWCAFRHSWPFSVANRLLWQLDAYRPTGARANDGYWWPLARTLRAKGNQARLRVLNELAGLPLDAGPSYTERKKPSRKETR